MSIKPKTVRCKQCKKKHDDISQTVSTPNQLGRFCDYDCVADYVKDNPLKIKELRNKQITKEKREYYADDLKTRKKAAKTACHKYIRERDRFKGCISCPAQLDGTKFDAGHLIESGNYPILRYNENNIFGQCVYCNQHKGGNEAMAREGAEKRIGKEEVQWLYDNKNKPIKRTVDDYREIESYYKDKLKQLKESE